MRAALMYAAGDVRVEDVPDPEIGEFEGETGALGSQSEDFSATIERAD